MRGNIEKTDQCLRDLDECLHDLEAGILDLSSSPFEPFIFSSVIKFEPRDLISFFTMHACHPVKIIEVLVVVIDFEFEVLSCFLPQNLQLWRAQG